MKLPITFGVVIPCYNESGTIKSCLEALKDQSKIDEIIVVDNNSTDATVDIVKRQKKIDPRIKLVTESRQGVQFARNKGFDAAKSDILARIDADTVVRSDWAEAIVSYYSDEANKKVGVASGCTGYYDLPAQKVTRFFANLFTNSVNSHLTNMNALHGANMTIRRAVWLKIRDEVCMQKGIMEDQDLGFHVMDHGYITAYMPAAKADASGRRMRMSPLRFWRYNGQWWRTYTSHNSYVHGGLIRLAVWSGNIMQAFAWVILLFHDPCTNRFSWSYFRSDKTERVIP